MLVKMYIRKEFLKEAPFETVVLAMAQELSHLVLGAMGHPLKHTEEAVDLTAMMLGYKNFYLIGYQYEVEKLNRIQLNLRKIFGRLFDYIAGKWMVVSEIRRVGYLTYSEIEFAADLMDREIKTPLSDLAKHWNRCAFKIVDK